MYSLGWHDLQQPRDNELKYKNSVWSDTDTAEHPSFSLWFWLPISVLLHLDTSWFCTFLFYFISQFLSPSVSPPPPPSGPVELSSVCGGVSPVPPVLSLSRSIKRRRTHAGCLKSPPTLPMGGELADAQTTKLYLDGRSILLICFCTPAIGFPLQPWTRHLFPLYCRL